MKRAAKVKQKIRDFRNRRTRNRMNVLMTPSAIGYPLGLIIHAGGRAATVGKSARHARREAEAI